jgi:ABC-2 type transport system ATP-binding protein
MSRPMERPHVVVCRGVTRCFGSQTVLDGIDLDVQAGTIVGLIGPSGCGKTTLIRTLVGIHQPDAGEICVLGTQPDKFTGAQRARLGYMPQLPALFPNLSVIDNLRFAAALYGVKVRGRRRRLRQMLEFVELTGDRTKLVRKASGGMQRRLALAGTLVHDPELIFLDEPTAGIDPILRDRFWQRFRQLRDEGRTLLVSTQYVGEAADCDVVAVMANGRVVALGPPDQLRRRAFGGDIVDLRPERGWFTPEEVTKLSTESFVVRVDRTAEGARVIVEDAAMDTSRLVDAVREMDTGAVALDQLTPSYDDIFVSIMEAANAGAETPA